MHFVLHFPANRGCNLQIIADFIKKPMSEKPLIQKKNPAISAIAGFLQMVEVRGIEPLTNPIKEQIKKNGGRWVFGVWVCPVVIEGDGIEAHEISLKGHIGAGSQMWLDDFNLYEAIHG